MVHLPDRNAGPKLIKNFQIGLVARGACGTLPGSGPRKEAFKRMGQENPGANQAHKSCNCLNHGDRPFFPSQNRTTEPLHSQKDFAGSAKIESD
jgi:hypothetical protein